MIFVDQSLDVHRTPAHLLSVDPADQRLVVRVFLAHAASLRHTSFFTRLKFKGFLHSFQTARMGHATSKSTSKTQLQKPLRERLKKKNGINNFCSSRLLR